jgi:Mg2+ and Co2+ transporter CorA
MPVLAAYLYRDGTRVRSVAIDETCDEAKDKSEFVWIGIADPTSVEMQALPELRARYTYPTVIGAILVICSLLYVRFKKARWI